MCTCTACPSPTAKALDDAGVAGLARARSRETLARAPQADADARDRDATFTAAWSEVAPRLEDTLRRWCGDAATREDIVQNTGAKVWAKQVPFCDADDLLPWAVTVARRELIDLRRRASRVTMVTLDVGDLPTAADAATVVEHRLRAESVARQLAKLSPLAREAIAWDVNGHEPWTRAEQLRWGSLLYKARKRLAATVDGFAGVVAWVRIRLVDIVRQPGLAPALVASAVVPVIVVVTTLGSPETQRRHPPGVVGIASRAAGTSAPASPGTATRGRGSPTTDDVAEVLPDGGAQAPPRRREPAEVTVPGPGGPIGSGDVREADDRTTKVCLENLPLVGSQCPVVLNPWD